MMEESFNQPVNPPVYQPKERQNNSLTAVILSVASLFIALSALVILFLVARPRSEPSPTESSAQKIRIAWINSDTIWNHYEFVADVKEELKAYEKELQNKYESRLMAFQNEYNDYIKKGTSNQLTLAQQKKTEEELAKKQQALTELDAQLSQQLLDEKTARNIEVHDTIVNFIARYNKAHNYTFILERSYGGSVLFADKALDITAEVLKGLNQEYQRIKKHRETAKGK